MVATIKDITVPTSLSIDGCTNVTITKGDSCQMRDVACDDCVVTALLSAGTGEEIGGETVDALRVLADGGLVPPLRMQWPQASSG